jgi:glycosyltransferase involved in cell wall biosynthesis
MLKLEKNMITIICVYNDKNKFENNLLKSLNLQDIKFDTIFIDNSNGCYKSMSMAYNNAISNAKGDFIMFVHQDVELPGRNWLRIAEQELQKCKNSAIIGLAGCKQNVKGVYTNISHGENLDYAGQYRITRPIHAQTVDECLFFVPKKILNLYKFDEETCDGWHLYGVDFSLKCLKQGYNVYLIKLPVFHHTKPVSMDENYFRILWKLIKKYKKEYLNINTTCGNWIVSRKAIILKLWCKEIIKRLIRKTIIKK